jgi:hypothetical protein
MPEAHAVFFAEPREFTQAQIDELREGGLLVEDEPAAEAPARTVTPPIKPPAASGAPADKPDKPEETP